MKKDLFEYRRKYDLSRHHAWAGSVLLAVLLAVRIFLEASDILFDDKIIITIGLVLVIYTLIAITLTYKYRSGLSNEQKIVEIKASSGSEELEKEKIRAEVEKEQLKTEKKKAKTEAKKAKKTEKK